MPDMAHVLEALAAVAVTSFARIVTGVRGNWRGCAPDPRPRVYFANHTSHGDFVLIWTVLPPALRRRRGRSPAPTTGTSGPLRRFFGDAGVPRRADRPQSDHPAATIRSP